MHCGSTTPTTKSYYSGTPGRKTTKDDDDSYHPLACGNPIDKGYDKDDDGPNCVERCVIPNVESEIRHPFAIGPLGTDCQEWSEDTLEKCIYQCSKEAEDERAYAREQYRRYSKEISDKMSGVHR